MAQKLCLIIEDSGTERVVIRTIMKQLGFDVKEAENGAQGMIFCGDAMPDVVILDIHMPIMDGIDFLKELRSVENGGDPFVICCSASSDANDYERAMKAGANESFIKPYDKDRIEKTLAKKMAA